MNRRDLCKLGTIPPQRTGCNLGDNPQEGPHRSAQHDSRTGPTTPVGLTPERITTDCVDLPASPPL